MQYIANDKQSNQCIELIILPQQ